MQSDGRPRGAIELNVVQFNSKLLDPFLVATILLYTVQYAEECS